MEALYGILGIAALVGLGFLLQKGKRAASRAVNQKVFYKTEYAEGQNFTQKPLRILSSASIPDIMREIDRQVKVETDHNKISPVLYISARNDSSIRYIFGNKFAANFDSVLSLKTENNRSVGTFQFLTWHDQDGIITRLDEMRILRNQITKAFSAVDPNCQINEG